MTSPRQLVTTSGLVVLLANIVLAAFPVHIEEVSCLANEDYCANVDCHAYLVRNKMQVLDFDMEITKALNNVLLHVQLFKKDAAGELKPYIVDATENVCKFLDSTERSNVISRLMPNWKHYGRFPERCPVKGVVSMRRYPLDLSFFPSTILEGDYQLRMTIIEGDLKLSILNTTVGFRVKY